MLDSKLYSRLLQLYSICLHIVDRTHDTIHFSLVLEPPYFSPLTSLPIHGEMLEKLIIAF